MSQTPGSHRLGTPLHSWCAALRQPACMQKAAIYYSAQPFHFFLQVSFENWIQSLNRAGQMGATKATLSGARGLMYCSVKGGIPSIGTTAAIVPGGPESSFRRWHVTYALDVFPEPGAPAIAKRYLQGKTLSEQRQEEWHKQACCDFPSWTKASFKTCSTA